MPLENATRYQCRIPPTTRHIDKEGEMESQRSAASAEGTNLRVDARVSARVDDLFADPEDACADESHDSLTEIVDVANRKRSTSRSRNSTTSVVINRRISDLQRESVTTDGLVDISMRFTRERLGALSISLDGGGREGSCGSAGSTGRSPSAVGSLSPSSAGSGSPDSFRRSRTSSLSICEIASDDGLSPTVVVAPATPEGLQAGRKTSCLDRVQIMKSSDRMQRVSQISTRQDMVDKPQTIICGSPPIDIPSTN
eukprot:690586_1